MPFADQAGITGTPVGFEKMISIGSRNSVTYVPAIAQRAVTSTIWVPGAKPRRAGATGVDAEHEDVVLRAWAASATRPAAS